MRKAGQALGAFFTSPATQQFGKRVAFDAGAGLAVNAITSALNPRITNTLSNTIQPEPQAAYVAHTDDLSAQQYQQAAIEHQRYLQKLSLIQAEKQPTEVRHQTYHDPVAMALDSYKIATSKRYV